VSYLVLLIGRRNELIMELERNWKDWKDFL